MLDALGGRRSADVALTPARKVLSLPTDSSREVAQVVSNGGQGLRGVVTEPKTRRDDEPVPVYAPRRRQRPGASVRSAGTSAYGRGT